MRIQSCLLKETKDGLQIVLAGGNGEVMKKFQELKAEDCGLVLCKVARIRKAGTRAKQAELDKEIEAMQVKKEKDEAKKQLSKVKAAAKTANAELAKVEKVAKS